MRLLLFFAFILVSAQVAWAKDIYPEPNPEKRLAYEAEAGICPISQLRVTVEDQGRNVGYTDSAEVLRHVLKFTGYRDMEQEGRRVTANIVDLTKMPFALDDRKHFFSCWDGRHDYAILGTPGGDIAEFITALAALELTSPTGRIFSEQQVHLILVDYLTTMNMQGRTHFYMHSDKTAVANWAKASGVADPLHPKTPSEAFAVEQTWRTGIGCDHLTNLIDRSTDFGVRRGLPDSVIKAFLRILRDPANPLSQRLIFTVLDGYHHEESAVINVLSPASPAPACTFTSPLVVPRIDQEHSTLVYHAKAVYEYRAHLSQYFASREGLPHPNMLNLFKAMNELGAQQLHLAKAADAATLPVYIAEFTN